jgi:hypothetical protein
MDLSNEEKELRATCTQLAVGMAMSANGFPCEAIEYARELYLFLAGKDPVVDVVTCCHENVVVMSEFVQDE